MTEPLIPRRDLDFLLYEWLRVEELFPRPAFSEHSRSTADAVLDLSERLAADLFLPHYQEADQHEPTLHDDGVHVHSAIGSALREYAAAGLFGASFDSGLGGIGLPHVLCSASFAQFAAANISTSAYIMLTVANARLIAKFGTRAQREHFAIPQIEGRWFGTMCLSEPQAGSSLSEIATRADFEGNDELGSRYLLRGNKMWISGGDQKISENIVHLVLAKVPDANGRLSEGTEALSLFIVPKWMPRGERNDVVVAGLNHKMGYRGAANCLLNFGESAGAIGWMVGEPGQGLRQMFVMMNEARISVGLGAAALAYRGYRRSLQYARERHQGRSRGTCDGPPIPIIYHPDVKRMLLAQKAYAEGALALCLYCAKLIDDQGDPEAEELLALLTPVAKTWPSEFGLAANDLAIQIHGGYGYTRDFDVEQIFRDNRLNPIHEGTTGIQALDLLGRKILRKGGRGYAIVRQRIDRCCAIAESIHALRDHARDLIDAWKAIDAVIGVLRGADDARAMDNATIFLRAFGHATVAWLWLDQAVISARALTDDGARYYSGKLNACRFFYEFELPNVHAWLKSVAALSDVAALAPEDTF